MLSNKLPIFSLVSMHFPANPESICVLNVGEFSQPIKKVFGFKNLIHLDTYMGFH